MSTNNDMLEGAELADLQSQIQGTVITRDNPRYDEARRAWNLTVDQHPALVVLVATAKDVVKAVQFAARHGLKISVQSTGHGVVRPADNTLLILMSNMKQVRIDADAQTAWIDAGARWGDVLGPAQDVGLTPLLGSSPQVGVMGYTLGGGIGWLVRKYGLATDSVNFFEVITADGRLIHASQTENTDLFWGLRGGGGSLGIVTGMEIKLYPVSTVYGGNLIYPVDMAQEVMRRYRDWIATAPDELTSSVVLINIPPLPELPEPLRGKSMVVVRGCYCGPVEAGEALVQPWRNWQQPFLDDFKTMPFSQVATISKDPETPMPALTTGAWLRELDDEAIDCLIQHTVPAGPGPKPLVFAEVRHVGGAVAKTDATVGAFGNRDASLHLQMLGLAPTPEIGSQLAQYTTRIKSQLESCLTGGVFMNFLEGEESQQQVQNGFSPEAYRRLVALKIAYDPDNLLYSGFNITPAR